jgi:GntR family transcriptional regulator
MSATESARTEIEKAIREGRLEPGDKLPSEPELAMQLGVSRNSLREALTSLEDAGIVVRHHGKGTFIAGSKPLVEGGIERLVSLMDFVSDHGHVPDSSLTEFDILLADSEIIERLYLEGPVEVVLIETVKTADGQPVALCRDYIPLHFLKDPVDPEAMQFSIFDGLMKEHEINIRFAECEISATLAEEKLANALCVEPNAPVLLLSQVHIDDSGRRVLHSKSYFPSDRFSFKLIRHR